MQKKEKVIVVSVHPDDETLGCGGTILKHIENGDDVYCLHITNGNAFQATTISTLNEMFSFKESIQLNLPEIELCDVSLNEIIPKISQVFKAIEPTILYIPNRSDPHSDHRQTFQALIACMKSFRYPSIKKILMMDVISETDFAPVLPENVFHANVFSDISSHFKRKMEIMSIFETELLPTPYTRSISTIEAYHRYKGSLINAEYAECFMLLKEIV